MNPSQRVQEFPNEELTVSSDDNLFCQACWENVFLKRSTIANHIKTVKHGEGKAKMIAKVEQEDMIAAALKKYDNMVDVKGQTLPSDQHIYWIKVVMAFLRAGVPLSKLEFFRGILEENALRLTGTRHMLNLVPFVLQEEKSKIKDEIKGKFVSVIFDRISRLGEVLAVVIHLIYGWEIKQRLVQLEFLAKSMTGEELAHELISVLSVSLGIKPNLLAGMMTDRDSVMMWLCVW